MISLEGRKEKKRMRKEQSPMKKEGDGMSLLVKEGRMEKY